MQAPRIRPIILSELQKRIIWHIRIYGPTSRSQLSAALGQSHAATTRLSKELISLGLIEEAGSEPLASRGRPMVPLRISGQGAYAAGATCHPGWVEVVLVDFAGHVLARLDQPFDSKDPVEFARVVETCLSQLAAKIGLTQRRFLGLGIAVPGPIVGPMERRAVVQWLEGWRDISLEEVFNYSLSVPVWIENDATAAALAEYYQENIVQRFSSALVFFLGHGIGGGLIAERELYRGEYGNAGEVGRLFPGTLEERPSGIDLIRFLNRKDIPINDLRAIDSLMDTHRPLFDTWMDRVAEQLKLAVACGTAWMDPGAIVISGALPEPILLGLAERLVNWEANHYPGQMPRIFASSIGSLAVCIGAGLVPIHAVSSHKWL